MILLTLLTFAALAPTGHAEPASARCDQIRSESAEVLTLPATACDESRETHATFTKAVPEVLAICSRLQAQANAGPIQLALGTEDDMQKEAMEARQRHITERSELNERVIHELLPTPLDNNDPARAPPKVSSDCGTEIESHVSFRRDLLNVISRFYRKIESDDDQLFQQAAERSLPAPASSPVKNVR